MSKSKTLRATVWFYFLLDLYCTLATILLIFGFYYWFLYIAAAIKCVSEIYILVKTSATIQRNHKRKRERETK